jgi:hypothetical protein
MQVSDQQIDYIQRDLELRGITMCELNESLIDHICCTIENSSHQDFNEAYLNAIQLFGPGKIPIIQKQTKLLLISKNSIIMKKLFFILSYLAAFLTTTGILFITMHWPGAGVILVSGIAIFNFGVLPMYFTNRYRQSVI